MALDCEDDSVFKLIINRTLSVEEVVVTATSITAVMKEGILSSRMDTFVAVEDPDQNCADDRTIRDTTSKTKRSPRGICRIVMGHLFRMK